MRHDTWDGLGYDDSDELMPDELGYGRGVRL